MTVCSGEELEVASAVAVSLNEVEKVIDNVRVGLRVSVSCDEVDTVVVGDAVSEFRRAVKVSISAESVNERDSVTETVDKKLCDADARAVSVDDPDLVRVGETEIVAFERDTKSLGESRVTTVLDIVMGEDCVKLWLEDMLTDFVSLASSDMDAEALFVSVGVSDIVRTGVMEPVLENVFDIESRVVAEKEYEADSVLSCDGLNERDSDIVFDGEPV